MRRPQEPSDRAVLERRARELARPVDDRPAATRRVLVWETAGTRLGVDVGAVRAVRRPDVVTRLPADAQPLEAAVEDRGVVVAVVPAAALLGLRRDGMTGGRLIVVDDGRHPPLALLTEGVPELVDLPVEAIGPARDDLRAPAPQLVAGVDRSGTVLLDAAALLTHPLFTVENARNEPA